MDRGRDIDRDRNIEMDRDIWIEMVPTILKKDTVEIIKQLEYTTLEKDNMYMHKVVRSTTVMINLYSIYIHLYVYI